MLSDRIRRLAQNRPPPTFLCEVCQQAPISNRNTTGRCRSCAAQARAHAGKSFTAEQQRNAGRARQRQIAYQRKLAELVRQVAPDVADQMALQVEAESRTSSRADSHTELRAGSAAQPSRLPATDTVAGK